jgi:hypothetical protein
MSNETKHSLGPWEIIYGSEHSPKGKTAYIKPINHGVFVTEVNMDRGYAEANAQLIATAPDMLEHIEWLIDELNKPDFNKDLIIAESATVRDKAKGI